MKAKLEEKDVLGRRGAAALVVFFVSGPVFFLLWVYFANSANNPLGGAWILPIAATLLCSIAAWFRPERLVRFVGNLLGVLPFLR